VGTHLSCSEEVIVLKVEHKKSEVECEFCGKRFMQNRYWQVFCSRKCKENSSATAKSEVRTLRLEVKELRFRLQEALNNVGTHNQGSTTFKYDDESQEWR
jgi:hypothetical protein